VSGSLDTNVKVWDPRMKSCLTTFKGHNDQITAVDISPDNLTIVSGSMDGTVKLWDLKANKLIKTIQVS
jgi:WD40 repeat protein